MNKESLLKAASIIDEVVDILEANVDASKSASDLEGSGYLENHFGGYEAPDAIELAANILKNQSQKYASLGSPLTYEGNETGGSSSVNDFDEMYLSGGIS